MPPIARFLPRNLSILTLQALLLVSLIWAILPHGQVESTSSLPVSASALSKADAATTARVQEAYGKLPRSFEANQGQADAGVNFLSRGNGYSFFLTPTEMVLALSKLRAGQADQESPAAQEAQDGNVFTTHKAVELTNAPPARAELRIKLVGANDAPKVMGLEELPGKTNYFIGTDCERWRTGIANYAKVKYEAVYPGVDVVYYGNQRQLEYDFVVAPGADPKRIRLAFKGADKLEIDEAGDLTLRVGEEEIRQHKPVIYQEVDGVRHEIAGRYVLLKTPHSSLQPPASSSVGFEIAKYDASKPLVIDPILVYSTYGGGTGFDSGNAIAVDSSGNAYVTGQTSSLDFPLEGQVQGANGGGNDIFVSKLNPAVTALIFSTYLRGANTDSNNGIAIDSFGNAYITGSTQLLYFPIAGPSPYQLTKAGGAPFYRSTDGQNWNSKSGNQVNSNLGTLANGATATVNIVVRPTAAGTITNPATVSSSLADPNTANSTATESAVVNAAAVNLTGAIQFSTNNSGNATSGGQVWNTLGGDSHFNLYAIDGDLGGAFINSGNGPATSINVPLPDGDYLLTIHGEQGGSDTGFAGLNLFFNGDNSTPGISVFAPLKTSMASDPAVSANSGSTRKLDGTSTPGAGTLTYVNGSTRVTLTRYFWAIPSVFTSDRVSSSNNVPSGNNDYIGQFLLSVRSGAQTADLSITKTDSPDPVIVGNNLTYTITATNNSPSIATGVTVTDTLPTGVTFISASPGCSLSGNTVTCNIGNLGGRVAESTFDSNNEGWTTFGDATSSSPTFFSTGGNPGGRVCATDASSGATWYFQVPAKFLGNVSSAYNGTLTFDLTQSATDSQYDDEDVVLIGGGLTLAFSTLNNPGTNWTSYSVPLNEAGWRNTANNQPATQAQMLQVLSSLTALRIRGEYRSGADTGCLDNVALNNGASAAVSLVVTPTTAGTISNTASVSSGVADPNTANNTATASTTVNAPAADLSVTKTDSPDPVTAGNNLTYTVIITNNGSNAATGVTLTDTLPASVTFVSATATQGSCAQSGGTVTCSIGSLANSATATATIVVTPTTAGTITNTANVTGNGSDPNTANNTATASTVVSEPTCTTPPSGMVSWWPADGNANDITGSSNGTLQNGATFTAGMVGQAFVFDGVNDYVSTNLDVQPSAMPSTTWDAWVFPTRVNHGSRQTIFSDDDVNFDRTVVIEAGTSNFGVFTGRGVWQPVAVTLNQWQHIAVVYTPTNIEFYKNGVRFSFNSAPTGQGTNNRFQIGRNPGFNEYYQGRIDEVEVFNRALSQTEVQSIYNAGSAGKCRQTTSSPDLSVTKTDNPDPATVGNNLTYTVTVTNNGPAAASGVRIVDALPVPTSSPAAPGVTFVSATSTQGSCSQSNSVVECAIGSLANGASATATIVVTPTGAGTITNMASVSGNESDSNGENNSATQSTTVNPATSSGPDLSITKSASPSVITPGSNVTYTLRVTNNGSTTAEAVNVTDNLPTGTTFVSCAATNGGVCEGTGNNRTIRFSSLASGVTATVTLVATVNSSVANGTVISNTATVGSSSTDPSPSNNSSTSVIRAYGLRAIRNLPGFTTNVFPANDDDSTNRVPIGFTVDFFGNSYNSLFVNNNGNVTFDEELSDYSPFPLTNTQKVIIAAFFNDVDTRGNGSNVVTYGNDTVNGRPAFGINYIDVGYYSQGTDKLNSFQIVLIDRSDIATGAFDIELNYDKIQWELEPPRAGFSNGTGNPGTSFELPGSGVSGAFLDSNTSTGLIHNRINSNQPGRYAFEVRQGSVTTGDLSVTNTDSPDPVSVGSDLTYTVRVTNNSSSPGTGVTLTDTLPAGVTFVSATSTQGSCSQSGGTVTCNIGTLASSATATVTIIVRPTATGTISNTATVTGAETDANPDNNTAAQSTTVVAAATASISGRIVDIVGNSISGVTVTLSGSQSATATTDANGNYLFANLTPGGSYTVTPSGTNFTFNPPSRAFNNLTGNQTADFTGRFEATLATPAGANVTVQIENTKISFANVSGAGTTTFRQIDPSTVGPLPAGHTVFSTRGAIDITTTATVSGPIAVCMTVPEINDPAVFSRLRLLHGEGNALVDRTMSSDFATRTICAGVDSLSPFVLTLVQLQTISGRIVGSNGAGLAGVTVTLSGSQSATTTTNANGNYSFSVLQGGSYTVTPFEINYVFSPPSRTFNNLSGDQTTADFTGTLVSFTISGRITDGNGNGIGDVTITLSGAGTQTTTTNVNGNYSFANVAAQGNYTVAPSKANYTFNPPSQSFSNLNSNQTADFTATLQPTPTPTPPPSEDFSCPQPDPQTQVCQRDPQKFNLGTLTEGPVSFDPQVSVTQQNGQLVITPRSGVEGSSFNGYVSVKAIDLTVTPIVSVEIVQPAAGNGAQTIFSIGNDQDNWYRFLITDEETAATATARGLQLARNNANGLKLFFQTNLGGSKFSTGINYDPTQHRFLRFRFDAATQRINFETSPNSVVWTLQYSSPISKPVTALVAELSAGTRKATTNPGKAIFDNYLVIAPNTLQFSAASYSVLENGGSVTIMVTRSGGSEGAAGVNFATGDGTARAGSDYTPVTGTLMFASGETSKTFNVSVINDALSEPDETINLTLSNPIGGVLGTLSTAVLTIIDDDRAGNPIDEARFFVRQQYLDFLNREPDQAGWDYWTNEITKCGNNARCIHSRRIGVSAAFFVENEFQRTGAFVYRLYKAAFGTRPSFAEFMRDRNLIREGSTLAADKQALLGEYITRSTFKNTYDGMNSVAYVDKLLANSGITLSPEVRAALIVGLLTGRETRATVLMKIVEDEDYAKEVYNESFVLMEYFGYLRRDPDEGGYQFWLDVLNGREKDNFLGMVCAFLTSREYQLRFGSAVTRTNADCGQ